MNQLTDLAFREVVKAEIAKIDALLVRHEVELRPFPEKAYRDFFYNVAVAFEKNETHRKLERMT